MKGESNRQDEWSCTGEATLDLARLM